MIVVHHLANSRSQRIIWLLEELGLPYSVKRYERNPKTMLAPPELKRIHPLGKSPVIEDGQITLIETGAIIEYLTRKSGSLGAEQCSNPLLWRQFIHYAEGSLMPPLLAILVIKKLGPLGWPARGTLLRMFSEHMRWLDDELENRDWFAGPEFSAADVMLSFPVEFATHWAGLDKRYPRLQEWLARIHARPAYKAALGRGGRYDYA
jgi:glutathione S-transferase